MASSCAKEVDGSVEQLVRILTLRAPNFTNMSRSENF